MKGAYNIQDDELFTVLKSLTEELTIKKIPYFVFGGINAQVYIASVETHNGQLDVKTVDARLLRRTGDIDIYIEAEQPELFFNEFAASRPKFKVSNKPKTSKIGDIHVNYLTKPEELKGFKDLALEQLVEAEQITIRKGNAVITLKISPVEYLLAAKLSGDRVYPKDEEDIENIIDVSKKNKEKINYAKIKELLIRIGKQHRYQLLEKILA